MFKIKRVQFKNHPVLGNLCLDFCNLEGNPVDTVIIAGENGTGKSTLLNMLFSAINYSVREEIKIVVDIGGQEIEFDYHYGSGSNSEIMFIRDSSGFETVQPSIEWGRRYGFHAIYSDVDINFQGNNIQAVTSTELDQNVSNQRSTSDLPTQIKQLIIDIQSMDDSDTAKSVREEMAKGSTLLDRIKLGGRINRFTDAFNKMFDNLTYSKVENRNNRKSILFTKNGKNVEIDNLSSGEKQIVYRGCFLLRDKNAINGAFVFIDEPEISLHPEWQKKILEYYKGIFMDDKGNQTSQLFVVTHSPFVIHNDRRVNDKVIVLKRDNIGNIIVSDKPEYYQCDSVAPIRDAFNIDDFTVDTAKSIVYLEGRTDEMYFKTALEVFGYGNVNFEFQWIGHMKNDKDEEFSGEKNMSHAVNFMKGRKPNATQIFLYDCDTNKQESDDGNIVIMCMPFYKQHTPMNKGVENALELDVVGDLEGFYRCNTQKKDYGGEAIIKELDKMKLCDYICGLDVKTQEKILTNLKPVIDKIVKRLG